MKSYNVFCTLCQCLDVICFLLKPFELSLKATTHSVNPQMKKEIGLFAYMKGLPILISHIISQHQDSIMCEHESLHIFKPKGKLPLTFK